MSINLSPLLALIRQHESAGDYNAIWGGISRSDYPKKPLTDMTIGEVLAWQDSIDRKYNSEAAGAYQFLEDTLRDIYGPAGFTESSPFNASTQDALAVFLLRRRDLSDYAAGIISAEAFANNLAKEWASFPVATGPNRGRSYYAGDGQNAAHAKVPEVLAAIRAINTETDMAQTPPVPAGRISREVRRLMLLAAGAALSQIGFIEFNAEALTATFDIGALADQLGWTITAAATGGGSLWWWKLAKRIGGAL